MYITWSTAQFIFHSLQKLHRLQIIRVPTRTTCFGYYIITTRRRKVLRSTTRLQKCNETQNQIYYYWIIFNICLYPWKSISSYIFFSFLVPLLKSLHTKLLYNNSCILLCSRSCAIFVHYKHHHNSAALHPSNTAHQLRKILHKANTMQCNKHKNTTREKRLDSIVCWISSFHLLPMHSRRDDSGCMTLQTPTL